MRATGHTARIRLYLNRDESAIKYTSEKYGARLRCVAQNILNDIPAAEECENDTYLQAWNAIPPSEPRGYFYPFLARIARNLALNICRSNSRLKRAAKIVELSQEMEQCISSPDDAESRLDNELLGGVISRFLAEQSAEKRCIFLRRYWFLDSISAIAKRYGISESKIKTILFRLREKLRDYLVKEGYEL